MDMCQKNMCLNQRLKEKEIRIVLILRFIIQGQKENILLGFLKTFVPLIQDRDREYLFVNIC